MSTMGFRWAWVVVMLAGCSPAPSPTGPTGGDGATSTGAGSPPAAVNVVGGWSSPSCGARTYTRTITLNEGGSFSAQDLVSPCPPGAQCIWSGIVDTTGSYSIQGTTIQLAPKPSAGRSAPQPFPTTLAIDPATQAIAEVLPDGTRCAYAHAPAAGGAAK